MALGIGATLACAACDAEFIDLRSEAELADGGFLIRTDTGATPADGGTGTGIDGGRPVDAGGRQDSGEAQGGDTVLRQGAWGGRGAYRGSGEATVVRRASGEVELVFSDDFSVSRVPGPFVVISFRDQLGTGINPAVGDVELAPLARNSGAQTYIIPPGLEDREYAWVYCKPFGVEVARATLEVR